ncbi:MAG: HAMP domain-containing histidine kinase, partial [Bacteroidaceae bacterium]|nr:HAMP domain-containing histidine kinase [Bacteroidaceae bacterium]
NIKQAAERMTSQLNSLLSFFRLDCGKEEVNLAPFRLTDIAETLEAEFRTQIEAKDEWDKVTGSWKNLLNNKSSKSHCTIL